MAEPETEPTEIALRAAEVATEITEAEEPQERRRLMSAFTRAATAGARAAGRGTRAVRRRAGSGTDWLVGQVVAMAPRVRVRDRAALQAQFPGQSAEDIADALIDGAARAAAAAGGAAGMAAALPVMPAFPAEIVAETLVVVGIELKLVAELHEAYGAPAPGNFTERTSAYLAAWAHRRGVFMVEGGLIIAAGSPLARVLRRRLTAKAGRSAVSLGPLLTGAAAAAVFNSRETKRLGRDIRRDLRRRAIARLPLRLEDRAGGGGVRVAGPVRPGQPAGTGLAADPSVHGSTASAAPPHGPAGIP